MHAVGMPRGPLPPYWHYAAFALSAAAAAAWATVWIWYSTWLNPPMVCGFDSIGNEICQAGGLFPVRPTDIYLIRMAYYAALGLTIACMVASFSVAELGWRRDAHPALWVSETALPIIPLVLAVFLSTGTLWSYNP